jgi:hypothetical protein
MVVPFTTTFTPGNVLPSSLDVTLPVTVLSCAHDVIDRLSKKEAKITLSRFFLIVCFLVYLIGAENYELISLLPNGYLLY